jgi:hypothetical protein
MVPEPRLIAEGITATLDQLDARSEEPLPDEVDLTVT